MSSEDDDLLARVREAATKLAVGDGLPMLERWYQAGVNPLISCLALIRLAYTLAPDGLTQTADGPEQFSHLCKLVAQKDGVLKEYSHPNDNAPG